MAAKDSSAPVLDRQAASVDPVGDSVTTRVDLLLTFIRQALEETDWTYDALVAEGCGDKGYISRVLSGEKPLSGRFLMGLPSDVRALVAEKWATASGRIVVAPVSGDQAVRNLVSGLFGVLALRQGLPERASKMAPASTAVKQRKAG